MVGTSGSLSKRSVYNHYLNVTKQVTKKPLISPTFFGKLVKRAFPSIKCNRKGPRGHTKQVPFIATTSSAAASSSCPDNYAAKCPGDPTTVT
jgi:hypothetical protein